MLAGETLGLSLPLRDARFGGVLWKPYIFVWGL